MFGLFNSKEKQIMSIVKPLSMIKDKTSKEVFNDTEKGGRSIWSQGFITGFSMWTILSRRNNMNDIDEDFSKKLIFDIQDTYKEVLQRLFGEIPSELLPDKNLEILQNSKWNDGYGYGWLDAEAWKIDGEMTLHWLKVMTGERSAGWM